MTQYRKYILLLVCTLLGFILVEIYRPKPTDWTTSYSNQDDIPYGTQVLYGLLPDVFPHQTITDTKFPVFAKRNTGYLLPSKSTYINIYRTFSLDSVNLAKLLGYVGQGNTAFVAAEDFGSLGDTLHVEVDYADSWKLKDSVSINFTNPLLKSSSNYPFQRASVDAYFAFSKTTQWQTLGYNNWGYANFIKMAFGRGFFYLSTVPKAFSNYYVIQNSSSEYAFKALSYLPQQTIFWDEYIQMPSFGKGFRTIAKSQKNLGDDSYDTSPFRYIVSQPALRWAYYLSILGILLFMIFEAKRRQRVIPIIETPKDTSLAFIETVGLLYFNNKDHTSIAHKKIAHFWAFVRNKFYLTTHIIDDDFKNDLSNKSGVTRQAVDELIDYITTIQRQQPPISEKQLVHLNFLIETFYHDTNY